MNSLCAFCLEPVDTDNSDNYREVRSWVNGPKLDGPVLREQTGRIAHKKCVDHLIHGQAPDQPELFEDESEVEIDIAHVVWGDGICRISYNGQGHFPCDQHEPAFGGNGDTECTCGFRPHREDCPRFGR